MTLSLSFSFLALLVVFVDYTYGSVHMYNDEKLTEQVNVRYYDGGSEGLYASSKTESSFIRFDDVTFVRTAESAHKQIPEKNLSTGLVETIILRGKDRNSIGGAYLNSDAVCCTTELARNGSCTFGEVIIRRDPEEPEWPIQINTYFEGNNTQAKMSPRDIVINKTDMYYVYYMVCDPELDGTVIRGRTVWKNPGGYLPGKVAPLRRFFLHMTLAYLLLGVVWVVWLAWFQTAKAQVHYHICLLIALGLFDMAIRYVECLDLNSTGMKLSFWTMWAVVTFLSMEKTITRFVVLDVCMAYKVLEHARGGLKSRILVLGGLYLIATECLESVVRLGDVNNIAGYTKLTFIVPVALLDIWYVLVIYSSLMRTYEKYTMRRDTAKIEFYRNLTIAFGVFFIISGVLVVFEGSFYVTDTMGRLRQEWLFPESWSVMSLAMLLVVCIMTTPSKLGESEDVMGY